MRDIDKGFYLWIPTQEFCNAILYRIVGFGLFQVGLASLLWLAALLAAVFSIVRKLTGSAVTGALALLLASTDYVVLITASDGRKDGTALWFLAIAAYLALRL